MLKAKLLFLFLLLSLITTLSYAQSPFTHAIIKLPFEVKIDSPWSRIIKSQEQLQQFYDENRTYISATPFPHVPPVIDFDVFSIVVGGLDWRYSHSKILVESVDSSSSTLYISAVILSPGGNCARAGFISYPNIAVLVPKHTGDLRIDTQEYVKDCGE